jgi:hypothetical protein
MSAFCSFASNASVLLAATPFVDPEHSKRRVCVCVCVRGPMYQADTNAQRMGFTPAVDSECVRGPERQKAYNNATRFQKGCLRNEALHSSNPPPLSHYPPSQSDTNVRRRGFTPANRLPALITSNDSAPSVGTPQSTFKKKCNKSVTGVLQEFYKSIL